MPVWAGGISMTDTYNRLTSLRSPYDIPKLGIQDLRTLLGLAYKEIAIVEQTLARAEEALNRGKSYERAGKESEKSILFSDRTKLEKVIMFCKMSPIGAAIFGLASFLFILMMFGVIPEWDIFFVPILGMFIYAPIRYFKDKKKLNTNLTDAKNMEYGDHKRLLNEAQQAINNLRMGILIPKDYRNTAALSKMIHLIDNQMAANDWMSLRTAFDNQKTNEERAAHQRFMERNSDKSIAMLRGMAADAERSANANEKTAMASERSAYANEISAKFNTRTAKAIEAIERYLR